MKPSTPADILECYLPLVRKVVNRMKINLPAHIDADDLYSIGIVGLMAAVQKFDPEHSVTFPGYAVTRIRGAILDELRRTDWCPRRTRVRSRELKAAIDGVEQNLGRLPTESEMCAATGLTPKEYTKWLMDTKPIIFISIDHVPKREDGDAPSIHNLLADENDVTARDGIEKTEFTQILTQRIAELPEQMRKVLAMHYFENMRFYEIGTALNLTCSRISQIHTKAILVLRKFLEQTRSNPK